MKPEHKEYEGHRIEVREGQDRLELLIDDVPKRYGQLPNGSYFLHEYAFDWSESLTEVAQRFIDHQLRAKEIRRGVASGAKEP